MSIPSISLTTPPFLVPGVDCAFEYVPRFSSLPSLSSVSENSSATSSSPIPSSSSSSTPSSSFTLHHYDWIGFDLDHALARYHVQALLRTIYACLSQALVNQCSYSRSIFQHRRPYSSSSSSSSSSPSVPIVHQRSRLSPSSSSSTRTGFDPYPGEPAWINDWCKDSYDPTFLHKGLIFDFRTGDLLKINMYGHIILAYHGLYPLTSTQIRQRYGVTEDGHNGIWSDFHLLREQKRHEAAFVLITYFDLPAQLTLCQCVQALDELYAKHTDNTLTVPSLSSFGPTDSPTSPPPSLLPDLDQCSSRYLHLQKDHVTAFNYIFDNVEAFESNRGGFFEALKASPSTYYLPRPRLAEHLRKLRLHHGKHIFLATNSHLQFATHALEFILGNDWRTCFDIIIFNSVKPAFFGRMTPFHHPDSLRRSDGTIANHLSIHVPYFLRKENDTLSSTDRGIFFDTVPAAPEFCQGNATTIQAMADATKWLKNRGYQYLYPSNIVNPDTEGITTKVPFITRVTAHVDEKGHVLKMTAKQVLQSSTSSATLVNEGSSDNTITKREIVIPLPRSVHKGGLLHPTKHHKLKTNGEEEDDDMSGTLTGKPAHIAAKTVAIPSEPSLSSSTPLLTSPHNHIHTNDNHIPVAKHEPSIIVSQLFDELSSPIDNETGEPLEMGGAEGSHPGHARILYIGDHMHGDIVAAVRECEWDTVAIVEEMEITLPLSRNDTTDSQHHVVPLPIPTHDKTHKDSLNLPNWEYEYTLLSPWGSFWSSGYDRVPIPSIQPNSKDTTDGSNANEKETNIMNRIDNYAIQRSWFCALLQANARIVVADADVLVYL